MDPVSAIAFGSKALGFLRRNWSLVLPGVVAAWGAWQYVGRVEAEGALADQKLQTAVDANATWVELEDKREAFEGEVREGLKNLRNTVSDLQAANTAFAAKVQSNANSRRALDPVERDALRLLANPGGGEAGGGAVPPSVASPRLR